MAINNLNHLLERWRRPASDPAGLSAAPASLSASPRRERNGAIDAGRYVCFLAVVLIHTADSSHFAASQDDGLARGLGSISAGQVIDQLARFAVPFYLVATGYFFARRSLAKTSDLFTTIVLRLVPAYVVWDAVYNLTDPAARAALTQPAFLLRLIFQGGVAPHLWYLPSVILCLALLIVAGRVLSLRGLVVLAGLLYATGLLLGSYFPLLFGKPASPLQMHIARDAAFFGFAFLVAGFALGRTQYRPKFPVAVAICGLGALLHFAEAGSFAALGLRNFSSNDYLIGTLPFGIGAFLIALSWPWFHGRTFGLARLGLLSLGLYAGHFFFVNLLGNVLHPSTLAERLITAGWTVVLTTLVTLSLAQFRILRFLLK